MQSGVDYFNVQRTVFSTTCSLGGAPSGQGGAAYLVGDSIGAQIQTALNSSLASKGWTLNANVLSSRNLSGTPPTPDGLGAVDQDSTLLQAASAVVVELGTNAGGFSAVTLNQMLDKIRSFAPNAAIYWVDTVVVERQDIAVALSAVNSIIHTQAPESNFQVIPWNKTVFGDAADPKAINPAAPDNGFIRHADQFVHLTETGIGALANLISTTITTGGPAGADCSCSENLVGADNAEKIYNFFIAKGLTPTQAAGFLGNMQAEAHFEPRLVEYGWLNSRGERSVPGQDSSLDDHVPPDQGPQGQPGYGLVQWTSPGRKQGLRDKEAASSGIPAGDLGLQLEYLWEELTTAYKFVYDQLVASTTLEEATFLILERYEVPANIEGNKPIRLGFASDLLVRFGSNTPGGAGAGQTCN